MVTRLPSAQIAGEREVAVATALPREPGGDDSPLGIDRDRADAAGGTEDGLHLTAGAERGVACAVCPEAMDAQTVRPAVLAADERSARASQIATE